MNQIQTDIRLSLLTAGGDSLPVPAEFAYSLDDPMAIHATFHAAGDTVVWVFSRDIMDAGLSGDSGVGDVRMWPGTDPGPDDGEPAKRFMYISLNSPEGLAVLEVDADVVKAFLDQTYELCPAGMEAFDVGRVHRVVPGPMMGAKVPLCPACVPPEGRPCLAVLPCVEHNVPTADVGWALWGNAYLGTP